MLPSCDTQYAPNLILQHGYAYDYDFLGQLISADYSNAEITNESYTYDENGNRVVANGSNYTTSTNNELTSDGTCSYTYDDEGNRISKQNSTNRELYEWDYRNRLTKVTQQTYNAETGAWETTQTIEYTYDYNNVWIRKIIGNEKTIFIPENYQTTVQIDNGTITHHYLWTPNTQDKLLADVTPTNTLWSLTDHLGTIRDIVGNSTTHLIYDAFGNLVSGTNPILFAYTGKAFDTSTSLQNNINRWYDATVGRWLSEDPISFNGGHNLYSYVSNGTLGAVDFFGTQEAGFELDAAVYIGIGASVNTKLIAQKAEPCCRDNVHYPKGFLTSFWQLSVEIGLGIGGKVGGVSLLWKAQQIGGEIEWSTQNTICGDYTSISDSEVRGAIRVKGGTSFSVGFIAGLEGSVVIDGTLNVHFKTGASATVSKLSVTLCGEVSFQGRAFIGTPFAGWYYSDTIHQKKNGCRPIYP